MNWKIKKRSSIAGMFLFIAGGMALYFTHSPGEKATFSCVTMKVEGGYGYIIERGNDTLIYQPYIPAVGQKVSFNTEEDARKVGTLVYNKLMRGDTPEVTPEEIIELHIQIQEGS